MIHIHAAIRALNPSIVTIRGEDAFDKDDNPVAYDMAKAVVKLAKMQADEEAQIQASFAKLAKIGLTPDDLKNILRVSHQPFLVAI